MRLRTAVVGLVSCVAVVLTACGNGPPYASDSGSSSSGGGGGGGAEAIVTTGTAKATVTEADALTFSPGDVSVKVGDIVEWTNGGSATHNVVFNDGTKSDDMSGGSTLLVQFTKAGDYAYICQYHAPGMKGTIHVS